MLAAAYLLFLQLLFGGLAMAAGTVPSILGDPSVFLGSADDPDPGAALPDGHLPAGHGHVRDCCGLGCTMSGSHLVAGFVAELLVPSLLGERAAAPRHTASVVAGARRSPANPRAPPALG